MLNLGILYQKTGKRELAIRHLSMFFDKAPRTQYGAMLPEVRQAIRELQAGAYEN